MTCTVCGFPKVRKGGHAEWCERVRAFLRGEVHGLYAITCDAKDRLVYRRPRV